MSLSPTNFVATNVEVMVKYIIGSKTSWCTGIVTEVHEYGIEDGNHYVECSIHFDDDEYDTVDTLWDYDYATSGEDAWKFTSNYAPLVTNVLDLVNNAEDTEDETDNDSDSSSSETLYDTEEEEDDESDTEEDEENDADEEDVQPLPRRRPSLLNRFFATLFVLSPLIATAGVIYNARDDIIGSLRVHYC